MVMMKKLRLEKPKYIFDRLKETFYTPRQKPLTENFFSNAHGKVKKQSLEQRDLTSWTDLTTCGWTFHGQMIAYEKNIKESFLYIYGLMIGILNLNKSSYLIV